MYLIFHQVSPELTLWAYYDDDDDDDDDVDDDDDPDDDDYYYCIDRSIDLNLSKSTQSAAGLKIFEAWCQSALLNGGTISLQ